MLEPKEGERHRATEMPLLPHPHVRVMVPHAGAAGRNAATLAKLGRVLRDRDVQACKGRIRGCVRQCTLESEQTVIILHFTVFVPFAIQAPLYLISFLS